LWLLKKGTKAVISGNFSVYARRTFNNLRTIFAVEIPEVAIRDGNVITEEYLGVEPK